MRRFAQWCWLAVVLVWGSAASTACPPGCTTHGTCNEELGRCDCPRHRSGPDCSFQLPLEQACAKWQYALDQCVANTTAAACLSRCHGRGACVGGWCHCQPGFYGSDCSLSLDAATARPQLLVGLGYEPNPRGPRVYVYELPPRFNTWRNLARHDRPLYVMLWQRLLSAGLRTPDPTHADYYFVPVDFRRMSRDTQHVLSYVKQTWPFWNQTSGARHLLLSTGDLGACDSGDMLRIRQATANATWLTFWGLTRKHPKVWWGGCHRPGLDVVLPVPSQTPRMLWSPLNPRVPQPRRNVTFYFSGRICGGGPPGRHDVWPVCSPTNPLYSAAVRQRVYHYHAGRPGYKIVPGSATYVQDMSTSKFCLAPTGGGHGKRQVLVGRFGCIPVPITDFVLQPFQPELNWTAFAVEALEDDIPSLHERLAAVSEGQLAGMQRSLACASRHLWWSSVWGGLFGEDGRYDAFATLMEILRLRIKYPDAAPQDYLRLDERWRKFAACELGDDGAGGKQARRGGESFSLCTYSADPGSEAVAPTALCPAAGGAYGHPGGAVCVGAPHVAACPRPWQ